MSPTEEARRNRRWSKVSTWLGVYIAIIVTLLAWGVWETLGEQEHQSRQIAAQSSELSRQAHRLGESNAQAAFAGCLRGNRLRAHINVISGALVTLLQRATAESTRNGMSLTAEQQTFLRHEYELLRAVPPVDCKAHYPHPSHARTAPAPSP